MNKKKILDKEIENDFAGLESSRGNSEDKQDRQKSREGQSEDGFFEKEPDEEGVEHTEESSSSKVDYQALWQRSMADLENIRKRCDQEKMDLSKYALMGFVSDLLPVVDNFYRATEHVPEDQKDSSWVTGIQYIQKQLIDILQANGVEEIVTNTGDLLDPNKHEVVETTSQEGLKDEEIVEVKNKGYKMGDKIIRPAKVKVNKNN